MDNIETAVEDIIAFLNSPEATVEVITTEAKNELIDRLTEFGVSYSLPRAV